MFNSSLIRKTLLFLIFAELLSLFAWLFPQFNLIAFFVILFVTLILSLHKLEYGIYILLAELFIGSKGYLFSYSLGETWLSIRIGLFIIVMAVWLLKFLQGALFCHSEGAERPKNPLSMFKGSFASLRMTKMWVLLFIVILCGLIWGLIQGNNFGDVFLDFNNWLYFLLVLPIFSLAKQEEFRQNILSVLVACVAWLGIKSLILLYIFSHSFEWALPELYKWVRDTRVGEITPAGAGFYRVFIQSQIFSLLFFFVLLWQDYKNKNYVLQIICLSTILLSFSRSYWLGLVFGLGMFFLTLIFLKKRFLDILKLFGKIVLVAIVSLAIVYLITTLPPGGGRIDLAGLFGKRATEMEAASSSRMAQLEPLTKEIIKHPVIGSGFGTTVTYLSDDPRIVPETAGGSGEFTTYAFEWGYLDMILKFGLVGLIIYMILIFNILKGLLISKKNSLFPVPGSRLNLGFSSALVALLVVNIFSPYLNHPLGIGFIILASIFSYE